MIHDHDLDEWELWEKFPQHHLWWNKLYVAEKFGYQCGPGATPIPESKQYVIRPIYNLAGMGIGAEVKFLEKGDRSSVPPGYFWCEYFKGTHYSASYIWNKASWKNIHCWIGDHLVFHRLFLRFESIFLLQKNSYQDYSDETDGVDQS